MTFRGNRHSHNEVLESRFDSWMLHQWVQINDANGLWDSYGWSVHQVQPLRYFEW